MQKLTPCFINTVSALIKNTAKTLTVGEFERVISAHGERGAHETVLGLFLPASRWALCRMSHSEGNFQDGDFAVISSNV